MPSSQRPAHLRRPSFAEEMKMPGLHFFKVTAMVVGTCLTVAVLSGAAFERAARDRDARKYPPAGRIVEVGGRKVQIDCRGAGSPTVVLESGLDNNGSLAWAAVHDSVAATTRTCAWSRPGIMWSEPTGRDFDADSNASTLHAALIAAGESAPWIMVGHSIGGPYVLTFASRYPDEVGGLVMVDASHPDQFARFEQAVGKSIMPSPTVPRIGAALAWTGLLRVLPQPPNPATWPGALDHAPAAYMSRSIDGLARELAAIPNTLEREGRAKFLGDK